MPGLVTKPSCSAMKNPARILAASEPVPHFDADFPRPVRRFQSEHARSERYKLGVLDVPVVHPRPDRKAALLGHQRKSVAPAALLRIGDVKVSQAGVGQHRSLRAAYEEVVLDA